MLPNKIDLTAGLHEVRSFNRFSFYGHRIRLIEVDFCAP